MEVLARTGGGFLQRGVSVSVLSETKRWHFSPRVVVGATVVPGDILGVVAESQTIEHRIMVPPYQRGQVLSIREGEFTIDETVAVIRSEAEAGYEQYEVSLVQPWPVRQPRPCQTRLPPREPLLTGTRIIDMFFPVAKGGSAIIPGGFGTGKTVIEHSLACWADADVVVYVGCGERGNEMTEVLEEFPKLEDPRTGAPLMHRTVLIANTSNMPVAAREASIYTGITIAEYYRDMGYDVLLLADSTSRWGEALREISGRLEEMPGEEGYPAYLAARLAEFYERSGRVICLSNHADTHSRIGSVSVVGAVSPPGGDFSEPVTQNSMRVASTFWALDYDLSRRRHFPAINWTNSYSLYDFHDWFEREVAPDCDELSKEAMMLLQREVELLEIVQLVGPDALAERERAVLAIARMLREDFLQQLAHADVDRYCSVQKAYWMLNTILDFYHHTQTALDAKVPLERITSLPILSDIARMKEIPMDIAEIEIRAIMDRVQFSFADLGVA
jgi:V/A-type H+-transporting ATPase subunit A